MENFQEAKRTRRQWKGNTGRFRGGKLVPVMFHAVRESEGGLLQQKVAIELDPIPGRLISEITAEMFTIFVPVQAMDMIKDASGAYAGITDVVRDKLLSSTPLFGTEPENTISRTAKVNPKSVAGVKRVSEAVKLAYNAAVNMLRQRIYYNATLLPYTNTAIAPAIYSKTVLDRINGVLDPEDRVNGRVNLTIPTMNLPIPGITRTGAANFTGSASVASAGSPYTVGVAGNNLNFAIGVGGQLTATFDGAATGVALDDFYNAETMDRFARIMDQMMRDNPTFGPEMVVRWAHGLSVDAGRTPFILAERRTTFSKSMAGAMDSAGVNDDVMRTDGAVLIDITVPIPRTELGGVIVTLIAIKPDEKLAAQPEPFLSEVWTHQNYVADSMALDPVAVTVRDMWSDCPQADETNVVAYTGLNALKEMYVDYGFARSVDLAQVDNKTAIWQVDVPLSVNPGNVNYPDYIDHGVFAYGGTQASPADVATFTVQSIQTSPTPMIVGPTPVEDIPVLGDTVWTN
jgi:hypothetical protein